MNNWENEGEKMVKITLIYLTQICSEVGTSVANPGIKLRSLSDVDTYRSLWYPVVVKSCRDITN